LLACKTTSCERKTLNLAIRRTTHARKKVESKIDVYASIPGMRDAPQQISNLPCLCANFRRTARALTQLYEEALRPLGLRGTQFTILQALQLAGDVSQGRLSDILAIDSTTLTRTLAIMSRRGWIARRRGEDGREWRLSLSPAGRKEFGRVSPSWERVQERLRAQLGDQRWKELFQLNNELTGFLKGEM
jgi:DNA-binding MarR family transcriptional regulator